MRNYLRRFVKLFLIIGACALFWSALRPSLDAAIEHTLKEQHLR